MSMREQRLRDRVLDWLERNHLRVVIGFIIAFVVILGLALCGAANATTLTGTFTYPTQYADVAGTPLPLSSIGHVQVEVGTCTGTPGAFGTKEGEQLVVPPTTTWTVTVPRTFGAFCVQARTVTVLGTASDYTPPVFRTIAEPKPKPPGAFVIATIAYELRTDPSTGGRYVRNVGTIQLGKECLGLAPQYGTDFFAVNRADVRLDVGVKKDATLVAQCGPA